MIAATPTSAQTSEPRLRHTINDGWAFVPLTACDGQATNPQEGMRPVALPHTWNAEDAFDKEAGYRRAAGWYARAFRVDPALEGKRLFVYFEGANQVARVSWSGTPLGEHIGGYSAFAFEVTDQVRFGEENILQVCVDNAHNPDIPPLDADFTFFGGIYRDVWLIATEPVHLAVTEYASPGVYFDTDFSEQGATVRMRATVDNQSINPQQVIVQHHLYSPSGQGLGTFDQAQRVRAEERARFEVTTPPIPAPMRWSPDTPHRYRVVTEVIVDGHVTDRVENHFGIREIRAVPGQGLFLNREPIRLIGTNRHQDWPGFGAALPNEMHVRDVEIVKENGFNFLRLAHYPQDPVVLETTDRLGLAVWEETPIVNTITQSAAFTENAERMVTEMVMQHYNHPSILMWGYMNEILLREPRPLPPNYREDVVALGQRLDDLVKRLDPRRPTVTAISHGEVDNGTGFQAIPDILGMNLYFGWYYYDFETLGTFLDTLHARHPKALLFVSEYGAGSDERVHAYAPVSFDFSSEHAQHFHTVSFPLMRARPYVVGTGIWNQFDFSSAGRQDTKNAINQKGIYYHDRTPKDIAYYYQALLRPAVPVLHLGREWLRRAGDTPADRQQPFWLYTNQPSVDVFVNGQRQGRYTPQNATVRLNVPLRHGPNRIEARAATDGGPGVSDAVVIHYDDRTDFFTNPTSAANAFAVNVGGAYQFVDPAGLVYAIDQPYAEGRWGYVGGDARRTHHRIYGTNDDPLFQAFRTAPEAYRFDVPDGTYTVTLGFAENERKERGERVFSALINGQPLVTDLDLRSPWNLTDDYGAWTATTRSMEVHASGGSGIDITFSAQTGKALVNSIVVRRK